MRLWSGLLQKYPKVTEQLIPHLQWSGKITYGNQIEVIPLLQLLHGSHNKALFIQMTIDYPATIEFISKHSWDYVFNTHELTLSDVLRDPGGVTLFAQIMKRRPSLIQDITPSNWYKKLGSQTPLNLLRRYGSALIPSLLELVPALREHYNPPVSIDRYKNKPLSTLPEPASPKEAPPLIIEVKRALKELHEKPIKTDLADPLIETSLAAIRRTTLVMLRQLKLSIEVEAFNMLTSVILTKLRVADASDLCLAFIMTLAPKIPQSLLHKLYIVQLACEKSPHLTHCIVLFGNLVNPLNVVNDDQGLETTKTVRKLKTIREFLTIEHPNTIIIDPLLQYTEFAENSLALIHYYEDNDMYVSKITAYDGLVIKQALINYDDYAPVNADFIKQIEIQVTLDILNEIAYEFILPFVSSEDRKKWKYLADKKYFCIRDEDVHLEAYFKVLSPYLNQDLVIHRLNDPKKLNFLIINKTPKHLDIANLFAAMQQKSFAPTANCRETTPPTPGFFSPVPSIPTQSPEPTASLSDQDTSSPISFTSN